MSAEAPRYYRLTGFRIESPKVHSTALALVYFTARRLRSKFGVETYGSFPHIGPAIIVLNHYSEHDGPIVLTVLKDTADRSIRTIMRHTLLDASAKEDEGVLQTTGKGQDTFVATESKLKRQIKAWALRNSGAIPIDRKDTGLKPELLSLVDEALDNKELVGIYLQMTRRPERDLLDAKLGAALLAQKHPFTPMIPMAVYQQDSVNQTGLYIVKIGEKITFEGVTEGITDPRRVLVFFHRALVDKIADMLPEPLKVCYLENKRRRSIIPPRGVF